MPVPKYENEFQFPESQGNIITLSLSVKSSTDDPEDIVICSHGQTEAQSYFKCPL